MPFDRMVRAADDWAASNSDVKCFAQIGESDFAPSHMPWTRLLDPETYKKKLAEAEVVVSHAGMGTIITAAEYSKPLILMPRRGALRETRNDHQIATAKWLAGLPGVCVVFDGSELRLALDKRSSLSPPSIRAANSPNLIEALRVFIAKS